MFLKAAAMVAACLLADAPPTPPPTPLQESQVQAIRETLALAPGDDLSVRVVWLDCGDENAAYDPDNHVVFICNEDALDPEWSIFAAAHEAGHAVVTQLDLPLDESPWTSEVAADELAALALIDAGDLEDIMAAADFHAQDADPPADDPHPPNKGRAFHIACMAMGATSEGSPYCQALYAQVHAKWLAAIAAAKQP